MRFFRATALYCLIFLLANVPGWHFAWVPLGYRYAHAVEVDLQFLKGKQFLDDNGSPLSGGKLFFYDAGTTNSRTVYSDAAGTVAQPNPIVLDSAGRLSSSVYIPTGSWKFLLTTSADVTVYSEDNIEGALDASALSTTYARPQTPVIAIASDTTVTTSQLGSFFACDATGGNVQITLPSAITAGDGQHITVQNIGASGTCTVTAVGGQTINATTNQQLTTLYQPIELVSDGANWRAIDQNVADGSITTAKLDNSILGQLTPVGTIIEFPTAGCPTGWLPANGDSVSRTTYAGLFAVIGTAYGNVDASTFNLPDLRGLFVRGFDDGAGTDPNASARTDRGDGTTGDAVGTQQADALEDHTHSDGSYVLSSNSITNGNSVRRGGSFANAGDGGLVNYVKSADTGTLSIANTDISGASGQMATGTASGETRPANISMRYCIFASAEIAGGGSSSLHTVLSGSGAPGSGLGSDGDFYIDTDVSDFYGPKAAGTWGSATSLIGPSATGHDYTFDTATADAEPGDGDIRFNNATIASVTEIYVDDTDANSVDVSADVLSWDDSATTALRGTLRIVDTATPSNFAVFNITGASTDATAYAKLTVTHVVSNGSFAADAALALAFSRTGNPGATGATGAAGATGADGTDPGIRWNFDSTTSMAEPGDGDVRLNNASLASVTAIAFDDNSGETGNPDASAFILSFDDINNTGARGTLILAKRGAPENFAVYNITGASTDNASWVQLAVTHVGSAGSFSDTDALSVRFAPAGADGAGTLTGSTGANDNRILRADGTGGTAVQSSSVQMDDSGNISAVGNLALTGTIGGGTTVTASGNINTTAGEVQENGTPISPIGKHTVAILAGSTTARTTNGCASGSTELATNDVMLVTMDCDAATDEAIQFRFPAPKSWNESTLTAIIDWTHPSTATNFDVVWGVRCLAIGNDDALDAAFGTAQTVTDTGGTANDHYTTAETSAITCSGTPAEGDSVVVEFYRDADNGSDTLAVDAQFISAKLLLTVDAANDN